MDSGRNLLKEQSLQELASALGLVIAQITPQVTTQVEKVLTATAHEARSREELQAATGMIDREHFRKAYIEPLVTAGWLERTIPDKPTSRLQKYRLGAKGGDWLSNSAARKRAHNSAGVGKVSTTRSMPVMKSNSMISLT